MWFITARIGLAALFSTRVLAHPSSSTAARSALQGRAIDLSAFRLKVEGQYSNVEKTSDIEIPASFNSPGYTETATSLVKTVFPEAEFRLVPDHYIGSNGIGHVVFRQTIHGLDVDNADFNVNVSATSTITI
jgi:extracellular elastinolytic metalloproteinase